MALVDEFWASYEGSPELKSANGHPFSQDQLLREIIFELRALRAEIAAVDLPLEVLEAPGVTLEVTPDPFNPSSVWSDDETETLPDDFPARDLLMEAGFRSVPAIANAGDLQLRTIKGIGPATLAEIREAIG